MKYLYFGTVCNAAAYERIIASCSVKPSVAPFVFESLLLEGFRKNGADVDAVSFPMIPAFPRSKKAFWGAVKEQLNCGYHNTWIPTINITGLKQLSQNIVSGQIIKKWIKKTQGEERAVVIYSVYGPIASNVIRYCKKNHIKCYAIVPDLPRDMYANIKIGKLKKILTDYSVKKTLKIQGDFDGYIYLTEAMKDVINPDAPYTVVEGIANVHLNPPEIKEKAAPPAIMYAGALNEKYGLKNIMEAFLLLRSEAQLWIFGAGDFEDAVVNYSKNNSKIKFFGRKSHDEVLAMERQATLLINARNVDDEFTKYSFPSKTIEYMASGTPLLTTRLAGIPEEYFSHCYSIPNNSIECLRDMMESAIKDAHQNVEMGKEAQDYITREKSPYRQAAKIIEFIRDTQ